LNTMALASDQLLLADIAHARSGDKGASANIGVIAFTADGYGLLKKHLTAGIVAKFFAPLGTTGVKRYELDNLGALNFALENILDGGGSVSLRADAQGKALGQQLLELRLSIADLTDGQLSCCLDPRRQKAQPS
jgi:hypothetical protein